MFDIYVIYSLKSTVYSKVSNGTFDGLKTITILSLRKNFIEELGASVFTDLVRVEELDLGQVPQSSYTYLSLRPSYSFELNLIHLKIFK